MNTAADIMTANPVTVTPGTEFGPQFLHQFRINFSQNKEKAVAAIERFLIILERYRKQ